jgi:hypothetical protein
VISTKRGSEIDFKPCCGETRKSPYIITGEEVLPIKICSSEIPIAEDPDAKILLKGTCPSCTDTCKFYGVTSKAGNIIRFTPCCDEKRTSPYVVTEQDEKEGFTICSTTVPTSKDPNSLIELKGDCPSCKTTCNSYGIKSKTGTVITFKPCCGETRKSPYAVTEQDEISGFSICSTTVPTSNDPNSDILLIDKCPSC